MDGQHLGPAMPDMNNPDTDARFDSRDWDAQWAERASQIKKLAAELESDMREAFPTFDSCELYIDEESDLYLAVRDIHQIADSI